MALLCTYSLEQRLKKYKRQAANYYGSPGRTQLNKLLVKGILASLAPLAATSMMPNSLAAQCNPAFPKSFNLVSSSQNKLVEGGFDYAGYGNIPLDVDNDGDIDFVLNFSATSSGDDFLRKLSISPYGDQDNAVIHKGDFVANIKRGENIPNKSAFVNLEVAATKTLYLAERKNGQERCEGFCTGEGTLGIVVNKARYGFLNISLDIKSAQEAQIIINSGGVHPEANKSVKAKCTALPYKLPFFQARPSANQVLVAWASDNSEEVYGLELQRSTDGEYFYKIDWKNTNDLKNSNKLIYEDKEVLSGQEYYYRIKRIHTDGTFMYSTPVNTSLAQKRAVASTQIGRIQSNAASKTATLNVNSPTGGKATLIVLNNERVAVKTVASDLQAGDNELSIPTSELASDTYFVKIEVDGKRAYRKLDLR